MLNIKHENFLPYSLLDENLTLFQDIMTTQDGESVQVMMVDADVPIETEVAADDNAGYCYFQIYSKL
jgi:hypothetical protein